jgi:hypothetical protein
MVLKQSNLLSSKFIGPKVKKGGHRPPFFIDKTSFRRHN